MEVDQKKSELHKRFHSVYMNDSSLDCAELAAGSAIEMTSAILENKIQNGLALLRPPGHHAMTEEGNGFCLLNNVAIAAKYARQAHPAKAEKVLIVDLDVHHGQGIQYQFYDDPNVMYFSIHRYENGEFWPHLREGNFDFIGGLEPLPSMGANINIPLNKTGLGDAEYLSTFHQVLLPILHEFRPDLILVSAGYDASIGCPEGQMKVTPAAYGHMIHSLMAFADGKLGVFLEGGYFIESLAEGVAMTLRALLGEPCLGLGPLQAPDPSLVETNLNVISMLRKPWQSLCLQDDFNILTYDVMTELDCHVPSLVYKGQALYEKCKIVQGEDYEVNDAKTIEEASKLIQSLKSKYELNLKRLQLAQIPVALVYDEDMMKHANIEEPSHPEQPLRIKRIHQKLEEFDLLKRLTHLQTRKATDEELLLVHDSSHVENMKAVEEMGQKEREDVADKLDSIYFNEHSYNAALLAAGNLLQVVDSVCNEEAQSGVAVIRPPGHHAEADEACGFCLFNNVALAAKYALEMHSVKRILILDWDVHHGNGIQNMFYDNPQVLYISLHRYDGGTFFPGKPDANHDFVGTGPGKGYNINIPWDDPGMGDPEYSLAFFGLIMPVAYQFNPDLVLVSSGFDAARGDPLGRCRISPEFYGFMTHHLRALANGKVIVALEGGYNLNSISLSMAMVTKALLGDPIPMLAPYSKPVPSAIEAVRGTMRSLAPFWSCLVYGLKRLPDDMTDLKKQMALKVSDFISSSAKNEIPDYIPSQFGAYAESFGVNTLSDIRTVWSSKKMELLTSDSIKKVERGDLSLVEAMQKIGLEETANNANLVAEPIKVSEEPKDPEVYIPGQYFMQGQSPSVYTFSSSASKSLSSSSPKTTDSKKN